MSLLLPPEPDVSHLVTEDDTPVDSIFAEKQLRLFVSALYQAWEPGRPFVAMSRVGLFSGIHEAALVPDILVSLGVELLPEPSKKENGSYLVWRYGKQPDLVIEVVATEDGGELEKGALYARQGVPYYAIFDPEHMLGDRTLRTYVRSGMSYVDLPDPSWIEDLQLGLTVWKGKFEGWDTEWLRPCDREGNLLLLVRERFPQAEEPVQAAPQPYAVVRERVRSERRRAEAAEAEVARLRARLRELGVEDP